MSIGSIYRSIFCKRPNKRVYGWAKDKLDHRDFKLSISQPNTALPKSVDLRPNCPPVYDQGNLGSCTSNAIAGAIEYDQKKQNAKKFYQPSRLFIYYNERAIEGTVSQDAGAQIRDGIKSVNAQGVCPETVWPYIETEFAVKPPVAAYVAAKLDVAVKYQSLVDTNETSLKACLAGGLPFVFGFNVFPEFESEAVAASGMLPMPGPRDRSIGGHAVLATGFDDAKQCFLVRNSWGADWGLAGYFWMPYAYMTNPNLTSDLWVIQSVSY